jgi:lysylphosphatidylglycerol synthetase-like protein (DUF2156 family)
MNNSISYNQSFSPELIAMTFLIFILLRIFAEDKIIRKNLFNISFIFIICSVFLNIFINIIFIFPIFFLSKDISFDFGTSFKKAFSFGIISVILYVLSYLLLLISWVGLLFSFNILKFNKKINTIEKKDNNFHDNIKED